MDSKKESAGIAKLFVDLLKARITTFPERRRRLDAPKEKGVYVIYKPDGRAAHVGSTPNARNGIAQRLGNHMSGLSSFTSQYLEGDGDLLRGKYRFRCLVVQNARKRALLEAFAIGQLCPLHIGHGRPNTDA